MAQTIKTDYQALRFVISTQLKKDLYFERKQLFKLKLAQAPTPLRYLYFFIEGTWLAPYVALIYGLVKRPVFGHLLKNRPIALEGQINDSAMMDRFQGLFEKHRIQRWRWHGLSLQTVFKRIQGGGKLLKVLRRLCKRHPFYAVLRVSEVVGFYAELAALIKSHQPQYLIISSEGNPPGIAALGISRRLGIPVIYIAHAPHVLNPAKMVCEAGVFWGRKSQEDFLAEGSLFHHSFFMGLGRPSQQEPKHKERICFCLSKSVNLHVLQEVLDLFRREGQSHHILVRPHPNSFLTRSRLQKILGDKVQLSSANLDHDLQGARLCIAGASSVHLESVARGVPSVYLMDLDGLEGAGNFPWAHLKIPQVKEVSLLRSHLHSTMVADKNLVSDYFNTQKTFEQFEGEFGKYLEGLEDSSEKPVLYHK